MPIPSSFPRYQGRYFSSYFEEYKRRAASEGIYNQGSSAAQKWFRDRAKNVWASSSFRKQFGEPSSLAFRSNLAELDNSIIGAVGKMLVFYYDAKTKEKLPYWDRFPLIFIVDSAKGGFYGLNLHYLFPHHRAVLFDLMTRGWKPKQDPKFPFHEDVVKGEDVPQYGLFMSGSDEKRRIRFSYQTLNSMRGLRMFKPAFKHYLNEHVVGQIRVVDPHEWEFAMMLPTEMFVRGGGNWKGMKGAVGSPFGKGLVWRDSQRKYGPI